jgi:hypothetical protein
MHEHICQELERVEIGSQDKMEAEKMVEVNAPSLSGNQGKEKEAVDDNQVLGYGRC